MVVWAVGGAVRVVEMVSLSPARSVGRPNYTIVWSTGIGHQRAPRPFGDCRGRIMENSLDPRSSLQKTIDPFTSDSALDRRGPARAPAAADLCCMLINYHLLV